MSTPVIIIGGSAGSLEPLLALTGALPASVVAPIVVVVHLPPSTPSLVPELLARVTHRSVCEVSDKLPLAEKTIHVAPPDYHVLVERDRTLALSLEPPVRFSRPSIDVVFESAADSIGAGAVGVVLSGANDDGAAGLARIAAAGGRAFVQDPATAAFPTMPSAAAARAPSAVALSISRLAARLALLP